MRDPQPHPFLGAVREGPADVVLCGVAWDGGASFRTGASEGPSGIRRFSEGIESYSPSLDRDLADLCLVDIGDHTGPPDAVAAELPGAALLAVLGGDHSITPPLAAAAAKRHEGLVVVGFDAHLDLRETYPGEHACTFRRIVEAGVPVFLCGVRSGERAEWERAPELLASCSRGLDVGAVGDRPVWVTVDVDVLDPSVAPGVANPEPDGVSFRELVAAMDALADAHVVGFDVVEVAPPLDPSGVTQATAAVLVREMLLRFASR